MSAAADRLHRRLMALVLAHPDKHEAARVVVHVASLASLRSVGTAATVDFFRDVADDVEHMVEVMQ